MSELEKWFNETLGSMIEPNAPFPSNEQLEAVVKNEERLTRWLLKTTVTVQQSSMFKEKDIVPKSLLPLIQNGPLPSDLWVELGWSEDARLDHRLIKGHPIINGGVFHQNQVHQDGFRFILQLNHLLLRIYRIPGAAPVLVVEQPVVVRGSREPRSVMSTMFFQGIWDFDRSLVISTGSL
jgi:hypothetical protein